MSHALLDKVNIRIIAFFEKDGIVSDLVWATRIPITTAYNRVAELTRARLLLIVDQVVTRSGRTVCYYRSNVARYLSDLDDHGKGRHIAKVELKDGSVIEEAFEA